MTHTRHVLLLTAALSLVGACRGDSDAPASASKPADAPAPEQPAPEQPAPEQLAAKQPASEQPTAPPPAAPPPTDLVKAKPPTNAPLEPYLMLSTGPAFEANNENCAFELESMPWSMVFTNWLELYDWMARDTGVDDHQRPKNEAEAKEWLHVEDGILVLAVIYAHAFYTSYAAVLQRDDGLLQLWQLGQPESDDSCPNAVEDEDLELALVALDGLEVVSVTFSDTVNVWTEVEDEAMHGCMADDDTHVDLIVELNSNISTMLTRSIVEIGDDGKGPDKVMELRLESDGLYVDGCGLRNKRLIRTVPGRPGYPG
jgi:hypothetical protein